MQLILPYGEIQQRLETPAPLNLPAVDLPVNTRSFSVSVASFFTDLCAAAENQNQPVHLADLGADLVLAFRSQGETASILNVRGDTPVGAVPFCNGSAYGPLVQAYQAARVGMTDLAANKRLWLTGHGVAGSFALLAAAELISHGKEIAAVYTFGAPRTGNAAFAKGLICPVFRIVNNLDVMTTMPTSWHWRHAGSHLLINADGSLNSRPNFFNRLPTFMQQNLWLVEMLKQGLNSGFPRSLYTLLNQVVGDHSLAIYRDRLQALSHYSK